MNPAIPCWGIYRESAHSPGRVSDDSLILDRVGEILADRGYQVGLLAADEIGGCLEEARAKVFAMCEQDANLDLLSAAEGRGAVVVNSPSAIRNTYRFRTVELFDAHDVPAPPSRIVATRPPAAYSGPSWLKRYDFHALRSDDVIHADTPEAWRDGLARFAERGIARVIAQQHVPGDIVKFYGVGTAGADAEWFEWYYPDENASKGYSFDMARLRGVTHHAASVAGVEIFGGDVIVRSDGEIFVIDLNAWPSFARFRDRAASAIADYLAGRFERGFGAETN